MTFVNEYVSEENINKYGLRALSKKWWNWLPLEFRYAWTYDSKRDSYFIPISRGREEYAHHLRCVLYFKGIYWDIEICHEPGGSDSYTEKPYRQIWGLIHIKHPEGGLAPTEEIVSVLKEALGVYKIRGVHTKVDDVVTLFAF